MPAVLSGCTQFISEHQGIERQRSTSLSSTDPLRITTAADLEEDGYGAQRRNGKENVDFVACSKRSDVSKC